MSIIQELENIKYHFVLDLIKTSEQYDKRKKVITGEEFHQLCYDRFLMVQKMLLPIKNVLGDYVDITDIVFTTGMQDDVGLMVNYIKNDKKYFLSVSNLDYEDISVVSSDSDIQNNYILDTYKNTIIEILRDISFLSLDSEVNVHTTSNKLIIKANCDRMILQDNDRKVFQIEESYANYLKSKSLSNPQHLFCNYSKLRELLMNQEVVLALYKHIYIYEDDIPKVLKKLTNS